MQDTRNNANPNTPTTTKSSSLISTPKRTRESPGATDNQEKKPKSSSMDTDQSSNQMFSIILQKFDDLQREMSTVNSTMRSMENSLKTLYDRFNSLSQEVITISSNQKLTDSNVNALGAEVNEIKQKITQIDVMKNQLDQDLLKNDVSAFGIPSKYIDKQDELINAFNQSFDLNLSRKSFKFLRFMNRKKQPTCNLFMRFSDNAQKSAFMAAVADLAKDVNGKRQPLTVDDVFEEYKDPNALTGLEINFSNSLTLFNRQIIKLKGTVKQAINFMWEQDGKILMKHNSTSRVMQALSPQHVLDYASKSPNQQGSSLLSELTTAQRK